MRVRVLLADHLEELRICVGVLEHLLLVALGVACVVGSEVYNHEIRLELAEIPVEV